jgi:serine/threonine-protein kinase HipA
MTDVEVHIGLEGQVRPLGILHHQASRRGETVTFEYDKTWFGDSAPDTWGRRLMQRAERSLAEREGRQVRTLGELHYLLGVADENRLGVLRFRWRGEEIFQSPVRDGVPALIELGRLLQITERIERDEEADDDLQLIFAPGSSLGGARPKASVIDQHGHLSIAKFPKESDDYSIETREEIALRLAEQAGIQTPEHALLQVAGKPVLLSRRFDRVSGDTHLAGSSSRSRSQAG